MWTCPSCDRVFATKRGHECSAGMPIEVWLDEQPEGYRGAAEAVLEVAAKLEGLVVEAVRVGIFIKRQRTIVEMRPKHRWLDVSFISAKVIASPRIARAIELATGTAYFVHLTKASDVDAELRRWLREALA